MTGRFPAALFLGAAMMVAGCPADPGDDDDVVELLDDDDDDDNGDDDGEGPETVPGAEDPAASLFDLAVVHQVEITVDDEGVDALSHSPYEYVVGEVTYDGEVLEDVGIRLKGRLGSFRPLTGKAAFLLDFNRYVEGGRFRGLKKLALNNMLNDAAQLHEVVAYPLYRDLGIPAPRTSYVWVRFNGEDYGLYVQVEGMDDVFLDVSYDDPTGNLYEAEYILYADYSYTLLDFDHDTYLFYELEEGVDMGHADLLAVADEVAASWGSETFHENVGAYVDWDHYLRFWVLESWLAQWDGYNHNSNNYLVYFDPVDGLADLLPWGHDWCFTDGRDWTAPWTLLGSGCRASEACTATFLDELEATCAAMDTDAVLDRIDLAAAVAESHIHADPRKETTFESALAYQELMRAWTPVRCGQLRTLFGVIEGAILVGEVAEGTVALWNEQGDLDLEGDVEAWNHGGTDVVVGGVTFDGTDGNGIPYASIVPSFDDDVGSFNAVESVAYTCAYQMPGNDMQALLPVTAGTAYQLQLLFFEPHYATQQGRKVHVLIDGVQTVTDLDTSTHTQRAGLLYTVEVTPASSTLEVIVRGSDWVSDGYPIITALVLEANP